MIRLLQSGIRIGGIVRDAGFEVDLSVSEEADLVHRQLAVYVTRDPRVSRDSIDRTIESEGADPDGSAVSNTLAIQAALSKGGLRTLMRKGTYAVTADAFVGAESSSVQIGPGVEFSINGVVMPLRTLEALDAGMIANTVQTVCTNHVDLGAGVADLAVKGGASAAVTLAVPESGAGLVNVFNADGRTSTAVSLVHRANTLRLSNSGSSVVLPSISLVATADAGWTLGMLVRIEVPNEQAGTTHLSFCKIGSGSAFALLGYEGQNATNPGVIKLLLPNAAASGVVAARQGLSSVHSPFHPSRHGQWAWIFARKHAAALTENVLSFSTGLEQSNVVFTDETVTLAWAPLQSADPDGVVVYAGTAGIAAGAFSAATAAASVGPDASNTGTFDVAKFFFIRQTLTAAQLGRMATGKRPHDIGITPVDATDVYYDFTTTVAASLLDVCGGTAATSVTLAGADAISPAAVRPRLTQFVGTADATALRAVYADGQARVFT